MRDLHPPDCKKPLLTLQDKKYYVVHYCNLQFYLAQGMKLKKVHRFLEFDWIEPYIRMNTDFRKKAEKHIRKRQQAHEQFAFRKDHGKFAQPR